MFDNQHHFQWRPEDAPSWLRQLESMRRDTRERFPKNIDPISEHEMTLQTHPPCKHLDSFGLDD
jgi:hypothetical protein